MARCLLLEMKQPKTLWVEAVNTSVYLLNRLLTRVTLGITPIEIWSGIKPSVSHLKIFGCVYYYHVPSSRRSKLDDKGTLASFLVMLVTQWSIA